MEYTLILKEIILKRLKATIDKLEALEPSQFNYIETVSVYDKKKKKGLVCSVLGFYPIWFAEYGFRYSSWKSHLISFKKKRCYGVYIAYSKKTRCYSSETYLEEYHGLSWTILTSLFYGERIWDENGPLFENDIDNSLAGVIEVWKKVYQLIETDVISTDYDDTPYHKEYTLPF